MFGQIGPSVSISANVRVGPGVRLRSCIILDDVELEVWMTIKYEYHHPRKVRILTEVALAGKCSRHKFYCRMEIISREMVKSPGKFVCSFPVYSHVLPHAKSVILAEDLYASELMAGKVCKN